jgi:hypothetical protein
MGELQRVLVMQDAWLRWISPADDCIFCFLLAWCAAVCVIPRCRPRLMLLPLVAFLPL